MTWKVSHYAVFVDRPDGNVLAFNSLHQRAALVKRENAEELRRIVADPNGYMSDSPGDPNLFQALCKSMFLVDGDLDEIELLKMRSLVGKFDPMHLALTLMPTLRCNFRCSYCYVSQQELDITKDMQKAVLAWIESQPFRQLSFGWFGGEPLLRLDVMQSMLSALQTLCEQRGSTFVSSMTTNGYLLTPDVARDLEALGLKHIQVTLDGPREVHDRMRPLSDGQGTFDVILQNVVSLLQSTQDVTLRLRVNLDANTLEDAYTFFETLPTALKDERVIIDPKIIFSHPGKWNASKGCEKSPELLHQTIEMLKYLAQQGYGIAFIGSLGYGGYIGCEFDFQNNFLIGPEGNLYKCTVSFELGDYVGRITPEGKATLNLPRFVKRMSKDPFTNKRCRKCKMLPLCGGGCGYRASIGERNCYLDLYGTTLQEVAEMFYLEQQLKKRPQPGPLRTGR